MTHVILKLLKTPSATSHDHCLTIIYNLLIKIQLMKVTAVAKVLSSCRVTLSNRK